MTATAPPTPTLRRRPRFLPVEVVSVRRLASRLVAVALGGEALADFRIEAPTQHIKMLFPAAGENTVVVPEFGPDGLVWPEGQPRPFVRTYTPRRVDAAAGTLDVELVVHGAGPASAWAERAAPGDRLVVAGPGGRLALGLDDGPWVIAGDESAIPAIGTLLEALPPGAEAEVYIEAEDEGDEIGIDGPVAAKVTWLHRGGVSAPGALLHDAVVTATISAGTKVWVACEAKAVRGIRRALLEAGRVDVGSLVTRGYWRAGEENHPDHDYGDDA
jgi:NADPH-dependent ferric siderophore reductase